MLFHRQRGILMRRRWSVWNHCWLLVTNIIVEMILNDWTPFWAVQKIALEIKFKQSRYSGRVVCILIWFRQNIVHAKSECAEMESDGNKKKNNNGWKQWYRDVCGARAQNINKIKLNIARFNKCICMRRTPATRPKPCLNFMENHMWIHCMLYTLLAP